MYSSVPVIIQIQVGLKFINCLSINHMFFWGHSRPHHISWWKVILLLQEASFYTFHNLIILLYPTSSDLCPLLPFHSAPCILHSDLSHLCSSFSGFSCFNLSLYVKLLSPGTSFGTTPWPPEFSLLLCIWFCNQWPHYCSVF